MQTCILSSGCLPQDTAEASISLLPVTQRSWTVTIRLAVAIDPQVRRHAAPRHVLVHPRDLTDAAASPRAQHPERVVGRGQQILREGEEGVAGEASERQRSREGRRPEKR